ncbi:hypothetical protein MNBD_UNCLBAC01-1635 [hydrothermal vent metagenome]|uniref:Glycosyltransferase RgtA/B/C/D-like domain-containing protein n=1 Tax=hydrothermal vent metagenome TaxID=652676 RepID=A0A3B1DRD9_9ZZZZ
MIIFAYIISFAIGWLIIETLLKNKNPFCISLQIPLAFALGLGISSLLTFISFLIGNGLHIWFVIGLNLLVLLILIFINKTNTACCVPTIKFSWSNIALTFFWIALYISIYTLSYRHPFGEWDAWALWNMKSKFLIFAGENWKAIFTDLHGHSQPDYPLLLPFIHTWSYCFSQQELIPIPRITAVAFATLCPMLLYGGLAQFAKKRIALMATGIIVINPFYIFLATAQYADILISFYLLASIITLISTLRYQNNSLALLCGLFLGLMTFIKNEGIVFMLLLAALFSFFILYENRRHWKLLGHLAAGIALTACATIFFKLFLAPPNKDILANLTNVELTFFNLKGLMIVKNAILHEFLHKRWCLVWLFLSFLFVIGVPKFFKKECKIITLFFISYFLVILYIYLTTINFDLTWRLKSTLHRILFYLLPSLLFFGFYVHWRNDEIKNASNT